MLNDSQFVTVHVMESRLESLKAKIERLEASMKHQFTMAELKAETKRAERQARLGWWLLAIVMVLGLLVAIPETSRKGSSAHPQIERAPSRL